MLKCSSCSSRLLMQFVAPKKRFICGADRCYLETQSDGSGTSQSVACTMLATSGEVTRHAASAVVSEFSDDELMANADAEEEPMPESI